MAKRPRTCVERDYTAYYARGMPSTYAGDPYERARYCHPHVKHQCMRTRSALAVARRVHTGLRRGGQRRRGWAGWERPRGVQAPERAVRGVSGAAPPAAGTRRGGAGRAHGGLRRGQRVAAQGAGVGQEEDRRRAGAGRHGALSRTGGGRDDVQAQGLRSGARSAKPYHGKGPRRSRSCSASTRAVLPQSCTDEFPTLLRSPWSDAKPGRSSACALCGRGRQGKLLEVNDRLVGTPALFAQQVRDCLPLPRSTAPHMCRVAVEERQRAVHCAHIRRHRAPLSGH
jgi:hypothetical protein